ncbi:MAG: PIN domain-containing protein [bacterium]
MVNKTYFLDTSYLIALLHKGDKWHETAISRRDEVIRNHILLLTTEYILVEVADGLSALHFRKQAEDTVSTLRDSQDVTVIPASTTLFDAGLSLYCARSDKEWSLTDCISFVVMEAHGLKEALATDKHFRQAGFHVLL